MVQSGRRLAMADGLGIESPWGARFSAPVHTGKDCDHPWLFYETKSGLRASLGNAPVN